jgi:hypothetical protein
MTQEGNDIVSRVAPVRKSKIVEEMKSYEKEPLMAVGRNDRSQAVNYILE